MKERGLLIQRSPACGENLRHRRLRPGRSGSRLDVRATGHRPSPEGQILSVPKFGGEKGDEPRARGVSGDLVMFADATPLLSKCGGMQSPPQGRYPSQRVGKESAESFLHKVSYAETRIQENTRQDWLQPPGWPISWCRQL